MFRLPKQEKRNELVDIEREAVRSFDKAMLTLSAGAFGVSILFIRNLYPDGNALVSEYWLFIAWSSFAASLVSTVFSFLLSQYAARKAREDLDEIRPESCWATWVDITNWLSVLFFVVGIITLLIFAITNVPKNG